MNFAFSEEQTAIRDAIAKICSGFDDAYWLKRDREGGFPHDFHAAFAAGGWQIGRASCRERVCT